MILYHGSNVEIVEVDISKSRVGKDFGCGFYLTPDYNIALNQARRRSDLEGGVPVVNMYEVDEDLMKSLNVKTFVGYSVSWALFLKKNRANRSRNQIHDFDMVVGPIADDDIGLQMRKLNDGRISLDDFMKALQWKRVTIQYFFGTENALKILRKI